jgi:hypothetical protein
MMKPRLHGQRQMNEILTPMIIPHYNVIQPSADYSDLPTAEDDDENLGGHNTLL